MTIPFELPVKASEAAALAGLVFQMAEARALTGELRQRIGNRLASLRFETLSPYPGSLQRDPTHQSVYYIAVDGSATPNTQQLLLRLALASSPASGLFPQSVLIGRMRPGGGREIIVNSIPFSPSDTRHILTFAQQVDPAFLPRPQGAQSSITVCGPHPEICLPAAFTAFRNIHRKTGLNLASVNGPYETCLWAAIRAGWREGYSAGAGPFVLSGSTEDEAANSLQAAKDAIRNSAGHTRFTIGAPNLSEPFPASPLEESFRRLLTEDEAGWVLDEFSPPFSIGDATYEFTPVEVMRLSVRLVPSLKLVEELYDTVRLTRIQSGFGRVFDFEISLDGPGILTTPQELLFCLHWLKSRGRPAQLVAPNLGPQASPSHLSTLAAVALYFNTTLSIQSVADLPPHLLTEITRATAGRWDYKISTPCDTAQIEWLAGQLRA